MRNWLRMGLFLTYLSPAYLSFYLSSTYEYLFIIYLSIYRSSISFLSLHFITFNKHIFKIAYYAPDKCAYGQF